MKIPEKLYNPNQEDQSIRGYIRAYNEYIRIISQEFYSEQGRMFGFSREQTLDALHTCFKTNIALRMLHILEKHCGEEPNLIIS